ncbi:hypothetical protein ACIP9C_18335 [Lysinibacillus sp. NPDC093210]|uniref:hypothetical protein n=1 Tax=Lysinibacillus sp. NPDC093210 TaxID=3364133 RepID=UPI0037F6CC2D
MNKIGNIGMDFDTFMEQLFIPEYKSKVQITILEVRIPVLKKIMNHFGKKIIVNITNLDIQIWKNSLTARGLRVFLS